MTVILVSISIIAAGIKIFLEKNSTNELIPKKIPVIRNDKILRP